MHFIHLPNTAEKGRETLVLQGKTAFSAAFLLVEVRRIERITGYLWSL